MSRVAFLSGASLSPNFPEIIAKAEWLSETHEREFIGSLGTLAAEPPLLQTLLHLLTDDTYAIRWESARVLAAIGDAGGVLQSWLDRIASNSKNKQFRADNPLCLQEGALWFGPSLCDPENSTPFARSFSELFENVKQACNNEEPGCRGAESSLAQGLKLAAVNGGSPIDPDRLRFATTQARFWFARFEATLAMGYLSARGRHEMEPALEGQEHDPHPFVRAAARAVSNVIEGDRPAERIWINEEEALSVAASVLRPDSLLLLADVALTLSLCSRGSQEQRDKNALRSDLPLCVRSGHDRFRLLSKAQCPNECGFNVCPFQHTAVSYWNRGPFPEAFCRDVRHAVSRVGPPPWYSGSTRSYLAIWIQIERDMSLRKI
jgi:hypothetical protein